jgi:type I restriction enzyme R subunit
MIDKTLSERDACTKYITPALAAAGWDLQTQVREEVYLNKGKITVRGKMVARGTRKFADYVLYYKPGVPIAVVEAKAPALSVAAGMQQAQVYAGMLDVPFVYSTNGEGFLEHDQSGTAEHMERELSLEEFPSPEQLWQRYCKARGIPLEAEKLVTQDYYTDGSGKLPRYYQTAAINRVVEAVARGQKRLLLVMATGTGKTMTAFQIIWRLWKAGARKRILFLADRNILADQARTNDFRPFGGAMTKISEGKVDKSFEIYLALYQAITSSEPNRDLFRLFSPDFFDLIVIDECHRGSADEDSAWREVLTYFSSATQIGLTATPKETTDVSTTHYFGEPVYTYSLKQGIEDGFLAPYKVVRIDFDRDLEGWRPTKGQLDKHGKEIEDRIYNQSDFDRTLIPQQRNIQVARKLTEFLKATDRFAKTIVFCEDTSHAERMRRALVNENADLVSQNRKYVMQITGDNKEGKAELDNFIHPEERYPVIVTTSKLLTTGVDAQTCKVIVLDQTIKSMTEFKQIVGRGTRIREDQGKLFFTILDFKRATELFADPAFDGTPVQIYEPGDDESPVPPDGPPPEGEEGSKAQGSGGEEGEDTDEPKKKRERYVVDNLPFHILREREQRYGADGKLITESLRDFSKRAVREKYASLDDFLRRWKESDRKKAIVDELLGEGVFFDELAEEVGRNLSEFDIICHVAYGQPPLTRKERANRVTKRDYFGKFGPQARAVLEALLARYADEDAARGADDIADISVLRVAPLSELGTPLEILGAFGGKDAYLKAVHELEEELYKAS